MIIKRNKIKRKKIKRVKSKLDDLKIKQDMEIGNKDYLGKKRNESNS